MGTCADGRRHGQPAGSSHHAIAELFDLLFVDIRPQEGQWPGAVKTNVRSPIKSIDITLQTAEKVGSCVVGGTPILTGFAKGPTGEVIVKLIEKHLLEPIGIGPGQDPALPAID